MSLLMRAILLFDLCAYNGFDDTLCLHASESFECSQRHFCRSPRRCKRLPSSQREATLPTQHSTAGLHGCAQIDGV